MLLVRRGLYSDSKKSTLPAAPAIIANDRSASMLTLALEQFALDPVGVDLEPSVPPNLLVNPGPSPEPMPEGLHRDVADQEDDDCQSGSVISSHQ
jgi:hypothetical protein